MAPMTREKRKLGQYFTPPGVAAQMVRLLRGPKSQAVLEPSAGEGVFLDALAAADYRDVCGVEIDAELASRPQPFAVEQASFVTWCAPRQFGAVIGNPPYVRWRELEHAAQQEVKQHPLWGKLFNSLSDYLTVFIANAVEMLADGGELVFITPSFWLHTQHSESLRGWLLERGSFTDMVEFGEAQVFPNVSSAIIIFRFERGSRSELIRRFKYHGRSAPRSDDLDLFDPEQFAIDEIPAFRPAAHWTVASSDEQEIANRLERSCRQSGGGAVALVGEFAHIANGMVSGLDKAFSYQVGDSTNLTAAECRALMPVAKARHLDRLRPLTLSSYLDIPAGLTATEFRHDYPNFYRHIAPHRGQLQKRFTYGKNIADWEWAFPRSEHFLRSMVWKGFVPCKERLTCREYVRFALVPPGVVATQDVTAFAPLPGVRESVEYLVGYLSLPAVSRWIRIRGLMRGGVAEFSERPLASIPFRYIDWSDPRDIQLHDAVSHAVRGAQRPNADGACERVAQLFAGVASRPVV